MSLSGTTNTYLPPTLDGLNIIEADEIYINGIPINTENLVPYTNATKNVNLGTFNFQTLGSITAKQHVFPSFGSTMMTGAMTSSIFYADAWEFNNTITISSLGGGAFLSTSYLRLADGSNNSTLLTLQSDGIADFANTKVRVSTMATDHYDVVNLSTLTSAVAFIENVNALNYLPYTGALQNLDMGGSTITTTGLMTAGTARFTSITSATPTLALGVDGSGNLNTFAVPTTAGLVPYTGANATVNLGSQNLIANTARFSGVVSATPSFALGIDGSGNLNSFAVPTSGSGTVNTSTTTARFLPYLSTATTLTNSLLNQIDNDSMGFGYTSIPNYPLGSAKNMYINGSIFAGGLNSMVGTFGRDTNTSNPANEITFTAGGSGILLSQIKSHSGSSAFVDATWTYSNTTPAPLGANQGQVLLTANKLSLSLPSGLVLAGGDLTMSITRTLFLYYLSATNHAGFITDGSGNLHIFTGTSGVANRLTITPAGDTYLSGNLYMNITRPIYLYYISATNHAGFYCEGSGDMLFFTGTGGVANRLRIASGGTATFSNALATNGNFTANSSIASINGGNSYAVPSGFMSAGSLTLGDQTKNYGGGTTYWNSSTAGLMMECAVNTEIAVHDGGDRVASFMYYSGNVFTIGRDMGWGLSRVSMPGIVSITGALTVGYDRYLYPPEASGATYGSLSMKGTGRNGWAGYSIYNDANQEVDFMCQNGFNNYGLYNNVVSRWNFYVDGGNQGDVAILNNENSRGFRTHNALTSNVIYNATPTTASNIGTWNGFGYTLLSNTQTPAGNAPCLGFGCNYSNTGQITCLQPGIAWMNLAIFNAQTTFTYFGVACGYTVPSGGANVSDVREKHCISDVCTKNSLRKIMCLKPKYYKRKYYDDGVDDQGNEKTKVPDDVKDAMCIGVMAQDLLETPLAPTVSIAPTKSDGACGDDDGTRYGVNYGDINIHLIGAVQEIVKQNNRQQEQIEDLLAYKELTEQRFEKMGLLIGDQQKLLEFLMSKLK